MVAAELESRIKSTIDNLPEQCRVIFCMSRFDGKTYSAIAAELNLSVKTIETQMGKALRVLREKLADMFNTNQAGMDELYNDIDTLIAKFLAGEATA